ncbi:double-stranded RNA-binding protein 1-like [Vigna umbellata]|uniref:double-stranded RNA-binding protein 1-like n=1 Tax=Vigna umbellata TaxID=87088 RepID=UPI001F5EF86D|nr:double-stranded RNA-binding protein 1-like [Vigna umbellata]
MYKTKVQELCQRRSWPLPTYDTTREGPDHDPRFTSTVTVNGVSFQTSAPTRNSKSAQNDAAMLAFLHFSPPSSSPSPSPSPPSPSFPQHTLSLPALSSFPQPSLCNSSSGAPDPRSVVDDVHLHSNGLLQLKLEEVCQTSQISNPLPAVRDTITVENQKNMLHLYKNQLQSFVQKKNLGLPVYSSEFEGPPHATRFKCKVTIDGHTYGGDKFYSTLKDAEHAAAGAALMSLLPGGVEEGHTGLYKNLLQELTQKEGFRLPIYSTNINGEAHMPLFVSQVEVEGVLFTGQEAKSKKQAEMSAAKVAYMALKEHKGKSDKSSSFPFSNYEGQVSKFSPDHSESNVVFCLKHDANPTSSVGLGLVTSSEHSTDTLKNVSTSGNTNGYTKVSTLSNDNSSPSLSGSSKMVSETSDKSSTAVYTTSSCIKKIVVYSRKTNVEIDDDGTMLPISDDKWVAYSYSH